MDIQSRCQPKVHMKFFHFRCHRFSKLPHQLFVPGLSQRCPHRKCRAELIVGIRMVMMLCLLQIPVFQRTQNARTIDRIRLLIYLIALAQTQARRSVCHDQ